jgi:hypothetical protein
MLNVPSRLTDNTFRQRSGLVSQYVANPPDASAADQPVEFSEPSHRFGHERGNLIPVRNVSFDTNDPVDAPSANNRWTQAAPMPLPAPVIKTALSSKRFIDASLSFGVPGIAKSSDGVVT